MLSKMLIWANLVAPVKETKVVVTMTIITQLELNFPAMTVPTQSLNSQRNRQTEQTRYDGVNENELDVLFLL